MGASNENESTSTLNVLNVGGQLPQAQSQQSTQTQPNPQQQSQKQTHPQTVFPKNIEKMFETFHQSPHGDFRPTFYNPFEVKHRRRTTKAQFKILERAFQDNCKPPAAHRRQLAAKLGMSPRAVQVWFQNRRAKLKTQQSKPLSRTTSSSDLSLKTIVSETSPIMYLSEVEEEDLEEGVNESDPEEPFDDDYKEELDNETRRPRSNSCPNIACELPFKPLQEALFGSFIPASEHLERAQPKRRQQTRQATNGYHGPYPVSAIFPAEPVEKGFAGAPALYLPTYPPGGVNPVHVQPHVQHPVHVQHQVQNHLHPGHTHHQQHIQQNNFITPSPGDDFDYLLQSAYVSPMIMDQWLYYPPAQPYTPGPSVSLGHVNGIGNSVGSIGHGLNQQNQHMNTKQPPDAFLMSFVEDASFEE